ncbi:hypothetical protein H8356DRAFT_937974 [Neocallimastix lanati (nom. inval.)]|jgi:hypothetical protein|uniref:Uncharacterized protein n=1 Tax=Neocallimastix californiae TaxID=1754190 RepID=A0A1Y2CLZ3_9FUNG|nr:hypothetical protein H8356DRAFT_937974 [Neocallimastix sp. JGI-2020a]ORY47956.1 hypothetical protein LY90DRAFT_671107 [Neocallimastix californiae]|eukprot:ORY47956.1 hypothetical protein LY90DRAFT_671107 [Neocallimastix californiae]
MSTNSKEKLIKSDNPPEYNSTESLNKDTVIDVDNEKPPRYSEYPPRPQMGTTSNEPELPEDRNAKDEYGRPIHCYRGGAHDWEESYASWGICLAVFCCPCGGIYCCNKLKDAKCKKCGYVFEAFPDKETKPDPAGEQARRLGFVAGYIAGSVN